MDSPVIAVVGGIVLIALGLVIIAFGDRQVGDKNRAGVITRTFSMPSLNVKVMKWGAGLLLIWFGTALVITRGHL